VQFLSVPWAQRMLWTISCAATWVGLEMTVARFLGGFPWNLLGDSQFRMLPLIHIAAFTGVYGVSFLLVWTSLSFMSSAIVIIGRPAMRSIWLGEIILPMLTVAAIYGVGYARLLRPEPKAPELSIALVQPSIPQSLIWDKNAEADRFKQLLALSESALTNKPDLLIWPEAAVPGLIRVDDQFRQPILDLARSHKTWIIIGADDFTPHPGAKTFADCDFFNSSFVISPAGEIVAEYRKRNLVIFGEYVPLTRWLPFLKHLTPITGGFTPGDGPVPFHLDNLNLNVSVLICFEDIFPHLAREYVSDDTDFLINLTNNGWFGEGAAQWQHAAAAIFRAIENGVPLVRCANNGLTCWADAQGRLKWFESTSHGIYGPGFMIVNVPVLAPGEKRAPTFYRLHGDRFGWGCVAFALLQVLRAFAKDHKSRPSQPLPAK
jgi:apolipoprotein N-acyltransferase